MMQGTRETTGYALIALAGIAVLAAVFSLDPLPQDPAYHRFADTRAFASIPNFADVASNMAFVLVGAAGLYQLLVSRALRIVPRNRAAYVLLFAGVLLVGAGSAWYHLAPANESLTWDRLPMTVAFMSLVSIVIAEHICPISGRRLLWPLIAVGVASVLYWHWSEAQGAGDLRFYILVQFLPMLALPVVLLFFPSRCTGSAAYWWLLLAYFAAKLFEHFDAAVYERTGFVSGHTLKHLAAALGVYLVLRAYSRRRCGEGRAE